MRGTHGSSEPDKGAELFWRAQVNRMQVRYLREILTTFAGDPPRMVVLFLGSEQKSPKSGNGAC